MNCLALYPFKLVAIWGVICPTSLNFTMFWTFASYHVLKVFVFSRTAEQFWILGGGGRASERQRLEFTRGVRGHAPPGNFGIPEIHSMLACKLTTFCLNIS